MARDAYCFKYQTEHRPSVQHRNADGLSRVRCRQCGLGSELESQKQEENVTDKLGVQSATSVNVFELNTETDNMCLKRKKSAK